MAAGSTNDFDLIVLGAGTGGYTAAFRAAQLGMRVALVDRARSAGRASTSAASRPRRCSNRPRCSPASRRPRSSGSCWKASPASTTTDRQAARPGREADVDRPQEPGRQEQGDVGRRPRPPRGRGHDPRLAQRRGRHAGRRRRAGPHGQERDPRHGQPRQEPAGHRAGRPADHHLGRRHDQGRSAQEHRHRRRGRCRRRVRLAVSTTSASASRCSNTCPGSSRSRIATSARPSSAASRGAASRSSRRPASTPRRSRSPPTASRCSSAPKAASRRRAASRPAADGDRTRPNTEDIGLETTKVELERGFVKVDGWMRTAEPHVYAIGDLIGGLMLAHVAAHEGIVAVHEIAGESPEADRLRPPAARHVHASRRSPRSA
jgi:hypothetical protein